MTRGEARYVDENAMRVSAPDTGQDGYRGRADYPSKSRDTHIGAPSETVHDRADSHCRAPSFTRDSRILTPQGVQEIRDLRPGDLVETIDRGPQQILWIGKTRQSRETLEAHPELCPIRLRRGALGPGLPRRDLVVSPQQRMVVSDPSLRREFGGSGTLIPAEAMIGTPGIDALPANRGWTLYHLLLGHHALLTVEGCAAESVPGEAVKTLEGGPTIQTGSLPRWKDGAEVTMLNNIDGRRVWASLRRRADRGERASNGAPSDAVHPQNRRIA